MRLVRPTRPQRRPRDAFSLIELLIVISILTLLITIVLPALKGARRNAHTLQGMSNLSQIGRAIQSYAIDHDSTLPIGWRHNGDENDTNWTTAVNGHMTGTGMTNATLDPVSFSEIFKDPNAAVDTGRVHYMAHPVLMPDLTRTSLPGYKVERIFRVAELVMAMDGCQVPPDYNSNATAWSLDRLGLWNEKNEPIYYTRDAADNGAPIDPGPDVDSIEGAGQIRWRQHRGRAANFLFCDAHVATSRPIEITKANIRPDR